MLSSVSLQSSSSVQFEREGQLIDKFVLCAINERLNVGESRRAASVSG